MIIATFPSGPFATNAYIVACETTREAAIIDPGLDSAKALKQFMIDNDLQPKMILLTHSHWDHIGNVALLKRELNLPVAIHPLDRENLENPGADKLPMITAIEPAEADLLLHEGETVAIGTHLFKVIHTPGHTPGGICFYCAEEGCLISGDTLFKGSIGNLSFPTSSPEAMWSSLKKLELLPSETTVYPGHGPSTTLTAEQRWLPHAKEYFGD